MSTLKETEARKRLIEESVADMYPEPEEKHDAKMRSCDAGY